MTRSEATGDIAADDAATLAQGATDEREGLMQDAYLYGLQEENERLQERREQAEADLAAALALLGRALAHLGGPIRYDIDAFLAAHSVAK